MREYLDSHDLAAEVRMARSSDPRTVLIVEGATDARFFERFIDREQCYVLAAHDRRRAVGVLRVLNSTPLPGILAIVDADFGRVLAALEDDPNLLFCDCHDLEMMLIRSPALDRIVAEHCSEEKLDAFLLKIEPQTVLAALLARSCVAIGSLLLISLTEDLGLTFDNLSFRDFVESDTLKVDVAKLVQTVLNKSSRHDAALANRLREDVLEILGKKPDAWEMARGHDCVELLAFALRSTIGTKKSKTEDRKTSPIDSSVLERELRLSFGETDFSNTALRLAIGEWELGNPGYCVMLPA